MIIESYVLDRFGTRFRYRCSDGCGRVGANYFAESMVRRDASRHDCNVQMINEYVPDSPSEHVTAEAKTTTEM